MSSRQLKKMMALPTLEAEPSEGEEESEEIDADEALFADMDEEGE